MATGHILPGYGDPVTRLRRVRSVGYPLDSSTLKELERNSVLSQQEFSQIKENAKLLWSKQPFRATTYDTFFSDGEIREITQSRPTSSHRRNNPHPSKPFMTNRLHFIEGYHKPDTTLGKSVYRVDASLSPSGQRNRQALREKYKSLPDSALTNLYKDPYGFRGFLPPTQCQAAEAWVKLADVKDHDKVMEVLRKQSDILQLQENERALRPNSAFPSLQRWMRSSGVEERNKIARLTETPYSTDGKNLDEAWICPSRLHLRRGEYIIHPGWPSSLPHHRVP